MGLNLTNNVEAYVELKEHIGHKVSCVGYGDIYAPVNVALECEDCNCVLIDFNAPEPPEVEPEERGEIDNFTNEEIGTILELARIALSDAEVYDYFADKLDLTDEELKNLQEKIERITG